MYLNKYGKLISTIISRFVFILPLMAILIISVPNTAMALSVGASPGKFEFNLSHNTTTGKLNIINTANRIAYYKVYIAEKDYQDLFIIEPNEFNLPANSNISVNITIQSISDLSTDLKVRICLVSISKDSGLKCGAGIRVPVYIHN